MYVDHTGPLTWLQRAWAAVLYTAPAALCLESALGDDSVPIQVAIARERSKPVAPLGVRIHQMAHIECANTVEPQSAAPALRRGRAGHRKSYVERLRCDCGAALEGRSTVRLSYHQVVGQPCRTAAKIAGLMRRQGLSVSGHPCGPECEFTELDAAA